MIFVTCCDYEHADFLFLALQFFFAQLADVKRRLYMWQSDSITKVRG